MLKDAFKIEFGNSYNRTTIADDPNTEEYDMNKRDEGFDEGDGFSPDKGDDSHHMERDQGQNMVEYEELEAEILRTCKETGTLWEDKDFPASQTSLYNVRTSSAILVNVILFIEHSKCTR